MRQKNFAIAPMPFAFDAGADVVPGMMALQHARENRQMRAYWLSLQGLAVEPEQLRGRFIRPQRAAVGIQGQNRKRAGFNQDAKLFFGFLPAANLLFELPQVFRQHPPAMIQLRNHKAGHRKTDRGYQHSSTSARCPLERIRHYRKWSM